MAILRMGSPVGDECAPILHRHDVNWNNRGNSVKTFMNSSNPYVMAGVMGWPVAQSRSPVIHNHWITQYGLRGAYGLFPVQPGQVEQAIRGMQALGIAGCNITIPHKVEAMAYMDMVDPVARRMGAINTIHVQPDGSLHGYNNDGFGYIQSIRDTQPDWRADTGPIVVLGAGGASRAVVLSLLDEGAPQIRLLNRSRDKADQLAAEFGSRVLALDWAQREEALRGAAMLVNTTNQGMYNQAPLDLRLDALSSRALVSDLIYIPLETELMRQAKARGNPTVGGLGMLLNQARPAFQKWFGIMPEITPELTNKVLGTF
jgi:shikimate dehydrogenase